MEDFNRIGFVVNNFEKLKGLSFLVMGLLFIGQSLIPFQPLQLGTEFLTPFLLASFGIPLLLMAFLPIYYKKSVGVVSAHPQKSKPGKIILAISLFILVMAAVIYEVSQKGTGFFFALFFAGILLTTPDFKENWARRRYIFPVAVLILLIGLLPLNQFFTFKNDFAASSLKNGLIIMLSYLPIGIFDHLMLLRQMRPFQADSIKNSQVSQDPILGDPANLTILAVLSNCQNADFVFLRKMSHLEETEFYRRITGLQQAGLVFIHEQPHGILSKVRSATITLLGWQIINQIYNEVGSNSVPPQALVHA